MGTRINEPSAIEQLFDLIHEAGCQPTVYGKPVTLRELRHHLASVISSTFQLDDIDAEWTRMLEKE